MVEAYDREFTLRISYLEVYNEQVRDLLNPEPTVIKIQNDGNRVFLTGVREVVVTSPQQVFERIYGPQSKSC
jgi:centromeric protein E